MRNALFVSVVAAGALMMAGCSDASSSTVIGRRGSSATTGGSPGDNAGGSKPNDPSEQPGALPDADQAANPNSTTTPQAPGTAGTTTGQLGVALSTATPATDLGTSIDITVTVEPKAGFKGQAVLSASGLPAGVTATFSPASVTINTTPATAKMTLQVPYTTVPSAPGAASAVVVKAMSGAVEATANANFKVNPKVTLTIPVNTAALLAAGGGAKNVDGWGGPGFGTKPLALQTQKGNNIAVEVVNKSDSPQTVHGNGNVGFIHDNGATAPGEVSKTVRSLPPGTNPNGATSCYLHGVANGTSVGCVVRVDLAPPGL